MTTSRIAWMILGALFVLPAAATADAPPGGAGIWQKHEYSFVSMGFTSTYSCDGLADKLKRLLLAAGALAGLGGMNLLIAWIVAILAALIGDSIWFGLGRWRGSSILDLLCRIALEPDTCVQKRRPPMPGTASTGCSSPNSYPA